MLKAFVDFCGKALAAKSSLSKSEIRGLIHSMKNSELPMDAVADESNCSSSSWVVDHVKSLLTEKRAEWAKEAEKEIEESVANKRAEWAKEAETEIGE